MVSAVRDLTTEPFRPTVIVSRGTVATLLSCDLDGTHIRRAFHRPGRGSYFAFDPVTWTAHHGWRRTSEDGSSIASGCAGIDPARD